jgi:hypothetical protein
MWGTASDRGLNTQCTLLRLHVRFEDDPMTDTEQVLQYIFDKKYGTYVQYIKLLSMRLAVSLCRVEYQCTHACVLSIT